MIFFPNDAREILVTRKQCKMYSLRKYRNFRQYLIATYLMTHELHLYSRYDVNIGGYNLTNYSNKLLSLHFNTPCTSNKSRIVIIIAITAGIVPKQYSHSAREMLNSACDATRGASGASAPLTKSVSNLLTREYLSAIIWIFEPISRCACTRLCPDRSFIFYCGAI